MQRYAQELERRLRKGLKATNDSWRVDETYVRVKGKWVYLYRAVDSEGATIDFLLSAKQDAAAAKRFLAKALGEGITRRRESSTPTSMPLTRRRYNLLSEPQIRLDLSPVAAGAEFDEMETRTLMANSINQQSGTSLDWRQSDFLESHSPTAFC